MSSAATQHSASRLMPETIRLLDFTLGYPSSGSQQSTCTAVLGAVESGSCAICAFWLGLIVPPSLSRPTLKSLRKAIREHESPQHRRLGVSFLGPVSSASRYSSVQTGPMQKELF